MRSTALHARAFGDDVGKAERARAAVFDAVELAFERAGIERVAQTDVQALGADRLDHEVDGARAHRGDDIVDAAVCGLHDHRHRDRGLPHLRQHAKPVEIRHHQVEDDAIDARAVRRVEQRQRGIAVVADQRLVAEFLQHAFEQAALHRIVIDNKDRHHSPGRSGAIRKSRASHVIAGLRRVLRNERISSKLDCRSI